MWGEQKLSSKFLAASFQEDPRGMFSVGVLYGQETGVEGRDRLGNGLAAWPPAGTHARGSCHLTSSPHARHPLQCRTPVQRSHGLTHMST